MRQLRTPADRSGTALCERDDRGRLLPLDALLRFREKCRFEPETGCVVWTGGVTMGRGHHHPYPSFWYEGRRWFGHRWAAKFIHGHDIDGFQVDHHCPNIAVPNTLCVQHVAPLTATDNRLLQTQRRQRFVFLQKGLLRFEDVYGYGPEPPEPDCFALPSYDPPEWLGPIAKVNSDECPF